MNQLPRVMIGMPVATGTLPWETHKSLVNTIRACDREKIPLQVEGPIGCSIVTWARSAVVGAFLKGDFTHLFWIDADMEWTLEDFFRLLGFAASHDVIGAAYPLKKDPPQVFVNTTDTETYEINGHGNVRVNSLGLGFTVVKREVIEKLAATKPMMTDNLNGLQYPDMFRIGRRVNGSGLGEDVAFFEDLAELGYSVWLDPSVNPGHIGKKIYKGDVIDALGLQDYAKGK